MPRPFQLSVVSPERTVFDDQVTSVIAPGVEGYLGVMAGHEPQIVALKPGLVEYEDKNGQRTFVATMGGFMEISWPKTPRSAPRFPSRRPRPNWTRPAALCEAKKWT
jgi:F-type H+-transporting ATPase subunit epsilon